MQSVGLAAPVVLAAILVVSAVAKIRSPRAAADSFISLRMPRWLANSVAPKLLPWAELVLALALLVLPGVLGVAASLVTLALMVAYLAVIVRALGFDEPVECGCFGELGLGDVHGRTGWRNAVLVAFAAVGLATAIFDDRAAVQRWWQAGAEHWGWLLISILMVVLAVLIIGGPPRAANPTDEVLVGGVETLDYQRQPTPFAQVSRADGSVVTIRELAREQAHLLLFLNNHCGPCLRVTERIGEWAAALAPAVAVRAVYATTGPDAMDLGDPRVAKVAPDALYDPEHHLITLLEAWGSPSAVLFGTDDMLAGGPVSGEDAVVEFVEEILAELEAARVDAAQVAAG